MPYRLSKSGKGRTVYVKKSGRWRKLKTHQSHAKALRHIRALSIHTGKKHK